MTGEGWGESEVKEAGLSEPRNKAHPTWSLRFTQPLSSSLLKPGFPPFSRSQHLDIFGAGLFLIPTQRDLAPCRGKARLPATEQRFALGLRCTGYGAESSCSQNRGFEPHLCLDQPYALGLCLHRL